MFFRMLNRCAYIFPEIYKHPFNKQLYNGSLPTTTFREYLKQDKLYLGDFSEALLLVSNRFTYDDYYALQFKSLSEYILGTERKFHIKYLGEEQPNVFFQGDKPVRKKIPVIEHYTQHILDTAINASKEEAVASLIPCFWIYCELGKQMDVSACPSSHPYRNWMASYSSERFTSATKSITQTIQELTTGISCPIHEEKIIASFLKSAEFELMFFDAIYHEQKKLLVDSAEYLIRPP